jgi:hypothetical protein
MRMVALVLAVATTGACAVAFGPLAATPTAAQTSCGPRVSAKGAPSLLQVLAKSKARSAWSEKVRTEKRLGEPYASWKHSRDSRVDCTKDGARSTCRASARPCKA